MDHLRPEVFKLHKMVELRQHPAFLSQDELLGQCQIESLRRSGPGGQRRNKVETGVRVIHLPTRLQVEATERRNRQENLREAVRRLRMQLALEVRTVMLGETPSSLWSSRCQQGRIVVSEQHQDFPALVAEALDAVHYFRGDIRPAAEWLRCTPSQLVKFLKKEPKAFAAVNKWRRQHGLSPLR